MLLFLKKIQTKVMAVRKFLDQYIFGFFGYTFIYTYFLNFLHQMIIHCLCQIPDLLYSFQEVCIPIKFSNETSNIFYRLHVLTNLQRTRYLKKKT